MKITLIRHQKVDFTWPSWCSSSEFDRACKEYDIAEIIPTSECDFNRQAVYVSGMKRSLDTAKALFPKGTFFVMENIREVMMCSFADYNGKLPLWMWNIMGRIQWKFGVKRQPESFRQTQKRAIDAIDFLENKNRDCVLVTHGFFMIILIRELKKKGYRFDKRKGMAFENLKKISAIKLI